MGRDSSDSVMPYVQEETLTYNMLRLMSHSQANTMAGGRRLHTRLSHARTFR